jgi:hypothetical protein
MLCKIIGLLSDLKIRFYVVYLFVTKKWRKYYLQDAFTLHFDGQCFDI